MATVLIADADEDIRASLRVLLEDAGYAVLEAADGETTLGVLRAIAEPLVVLLNHFRTRTSSADVLRALASDLRLARHAYIFVTTTPQRLAPDLSLLVLGRALPVISKPFDIDQVLGIVEAAERRLAASPVPAAYQADGK